MDKFDQMVEAMEDNEDIVECKECFDLFPKAQGTKLKVGYICPTCKRTMDTCGMERCWTKEDTRKFESGLSQFALTNDLFGQEFPEVTEYDPGTTRTFRDESTVFSALDDLIADEYDAIDGYEVADEKVQQSPIDDEQKDDILDTIEHIKEEEEEHIDELKELKGEKPEDEESADSDEDEDEDDLDEGCKDCKEGKCKKHKAINHTAYDEKILNESEEPATTPAEVVQKIKEAASEFEDVEPVEEAYLDTVMRDRARAEASNRLPRFGLDGVADAYNDANPGAELASRDIERSFETPDEFEDSSNAQVYIATDISRGGELIAACRARDEDEAYRKLALAFMERTGKSGSQLEDCYIEPASEEDIDFLTDDDFVTESLTEEMLNEAEPGIFRRGLDALKKGAAGLVRTLTHAKVNLPEIFNKGFYLYIPGANPTQYTDNNGQIHMRELNVDLKKAEEVAKAASKILKQNNVTVQLMANADGVEIEDPNVKKLVDKYLARNKQGWWLASYARGTCVTNNIETINKGLKELELANRDLAGTGGSNLVDIDLLRDEKLKELGSLLPAAEYTKDSYAKYKEAFETVVKEIRAIEKTADLQAYDVAAKKKEAEDLLEEKSGLEDEEDSPLDALLKQVKEILGEKADPAKYTPESYKDYSSAFDKAANIVEGAKTENKLKALVRDLPAYMERVNAILKEKAGTDATDQDEDPNLDDDDEVDPKEKAKQMLGEKKAADGYTPESYKKYETAYGRIVAWIEAHAKPETLTQDRIDNLRKQAEAKLVAAPDDDPDLGDDDEDEGENLGEQLEAAKKEALEALGAMLTESEKYTPESWEKYTKAYEAIAEKINSCETVDEVKALDIAKLKSQAEALLEEAQIEDAGIEDEPEDEDGDEGEDEEPTGEEGEEEEPAEEEEESAEEEEESAESAPTGGLKHQEGRQLDRSARRSAGKPIGTWLANFFNELNMKTDTDAQLAAETIKKFIEDNKDRFMFSEAFTAKLLAECDKALSIKSLQEGLNKLLEERQVTCVWCGQDYPIDSCRNELDMGWLCDRCEQAMKSRGEKLTFEEDLMTDADAVALNADTSKALKSAAAGMKSMAAAMKG